MTTIKIDPQEVAAVSRFLVTFLSESFPDADFSPGSVTRDHTVGAIATVVAFLRAERDKAQRTWSIRKLNEIEDDREYSEAVQDIISNLFLDLNPGVPVSGTLTWHFSEPHQGTIPAGSVFTYSRGVTYELNQTEAFIYTSSDFEPFVNAQGEIQDYILRVPVIATQPGPAWRVQAGQLGRTPEVSDFQLYAEFEEDLTGGSDPLNADELLQLAPVAVSTRDLSSDRSTQYTLTQAYNQIDRLLIYGMGDPGQIRDVNDNPNSFYKVHRGGHVDIYVGLPLQTNRVYDAQVGGAFVDQRTRVTHFTDDTVTDWRKHLKGHEILRIRNATTDEPDFYLIEEVHKTRLKVRATQPFPSARPAQLRDGAAFSPIEIRSPDTVYSPNAEFNDADVGSWVRIENATTSANNGAFLIKSTDSQAFTATLETSALVNETGTAATLELFDGLVIYSIGDNAPVYDNAISERSTGRFSDVYARKGEILMPFEPFYTIQSVQVLAPGDPAADPITGYVTFERSNKTPVYKETGTLEYQVLVDNVREAYSTRQFARLSLRTEPIKTGTRATLSVSRTFTANYNAFEASHVGKTLTVRNAYHKENIGDFLIDAYLSPTQVTVKNPDDASWVPKAEGRLGWDLHWPDRFDGDQCRVVYDSPQDFADVASYTQDESRRHTAADILCKAFIPVYLTFEIRYSLQPNSQNVFNEDEAKQTLTRFVNNFPVDDVIDVSDLVTEFHNYDRTLIGNVELPITIRYSLFAPDGRVIPYSTQDRVLLNAGKSTALGPDEELDKPADLGITDENIRYLTRPDLITLTRTD